MNWYPPQDAYRRGMRHGRVGLVTDMQKLRDMLTLAKSTQARNLHAYALGAMRGVREHA